MGQKAEPRRTKCKTDSGSHPKVLSSISPPSQISPLPQVNLSAVPPIPPEDEFYDCLGSDDEADRGHFVDQCGQPNLGGSDSSLLSMVNLIFASVSATLSIMKTALGATALSG